MKRLRDEGKSLIHWATGLTAMLRIVLLSIAFSQCMGLNLAQAVEPEAPKTAAVETVQPVTHDFFLSLPWFGRVVATQSVTLTARVLGSIASIAVEDGASVRSDDIVFELGGSEIESRRSDLQTQLQSAQQNLTLALKNLDIRQSLLSEHLSSKELMNAAKQAVAQATAQLSSAKQALTVFDANVSIRAPINGIFTARAVNMGQYVSLGSVLANIVNPDHVRIQASLFPPSGMPLNGLRAIVGGTSDAIVWHGSVQRVLPDADADGAVQVWIEGDGLAGLRPGASLSGELVGVSHLAWAIPASAIARNEQGEAFVFIQTPQSPRSQPIQTGLVAHGWVEIISGLEGNEKIVTNGAYELLYGDFSKIYRAPD